MRSRVRAQTGAVFRRARSVLGASVPTPIIDSGPTFTDNEDGTGSFALTTDIATYAGADYGASSGAYTLSAFDYSGAGPALELGTSHTIPIPDALAGGTNFGSWFYRVWLATPAGFSGYVGAESTFAIAPVLSSETDGTPTTDGATDATVDTNCPTGTLCYGFVTNGGSCTNAQLIAGTGGNLVAGTTGSQAVNGTGTQTFSVTGAAPATTYQLKTLHVVQGAESVQGSVSVTTTSATGTITLDATNNWSQTAFVSGGASIGTYTLGANPGVDVKIICAVFVDPGTSVTSLSDNFGDAGTWNLDIGPASSGGANNRVYIYSKTTLSGAGSGKVITVNTNAGGFLSIVAGQYNKTSGTWALDGTPTLASNGTGSTVVCDTPSATITVGDGSLIVGFAVDLSGSTLTATGGFTNVATFNSSGSRPSVVEHQIVSGAGAYTPGWSGGNFWVIVAAGYKVN